MQSGDVPRTLADVRRRSTWGVVALATRGGAGKLVTMASTVFLSRLLLPADFGAFAILQLPLGWLNLVADAGISAAMIQAKELTPADERTGFTLRLLGVVVLGVLLVLGAGLVGKIYDLTADAVQALRILAVGPFLSALGTVPSVRLTRALRFDRLALAEMGSLLAGQGMAVGLAWAGAGLWSLVAGSLVTIATGSLLVNLFAPWSIGVGVQPDRIRALYRFGLPYQGQGVVHLAKDQVIPVLGGLAFSGTQVGYLIWAQDIARWPRLPADYVIRVAFPAFSRLQHDPAGLGRLLREALTVVCALSFTAVAVGIVLGPTLVPLIFGPTWVPAVPVLLIFLAQTPLDALAAVLLPLIYASGQVRQGLRLSAVWATLTWFFSLVALARWHDWRALPLAFGLAMIFAVALIGRRLPHGVRVNWRVTVGVPLALALLLGGLSHLLSKLWISP